MVNETIGPYHPDEPLIEKWPAAKLPTHDSKKRAG